jgi:hypothetical protein
VGLAGRHREDQRVSSEKRIANGRGCWRIVEPDRVLVFTWSRADDSGHLPESRKSLSSLHRAVANFVEVRFNGGEVADSADSEAKEA